MENETPKRESISEVIKKYKTATTGQEQSVTTNAVGVALPKPPQFNPQDFEKKMAQETDPDLMTSYEIIKLPSQGMFYQSRIAEVSVEYMTSKDEDLLTTPSLIENGTVLDVLLRRKIKTLGISPSELLAGDRNAVLLFLRTSSYGADYTVQVSDPRSGIPFNEVVNLCKLKYKEVKELPDEYGYFIVEIPMRKKTVTIRLVSSGEENILYKKAKAIQEAYGQDISEYSTMKLKAHIVAINEKTDRAYIDKFVDAMPALDALTIRKKLIDVNPDVDMSYQFMAKDGYTFTANLSVGVDFFFPGT